VIIFNASLWRADYSARGRRVAFAFLTLSSGYMRNILFNMGIDSRRMLAAPRDFRGSRFCCCQEVKSFACFSSEKEESSFF
jgi:hypothetical protein